MRGDTEDYEAELSRSQNTIRIFTSELCTAGTEGVLEVEAGQACWCLHWNYHPPALHWRPQPHHPSPRARPTRSHPECRHDLILVLHASAPRLSSRGRPRDLVSLRDAGLCQYPSPPDWHVEITLQSLCPDNQGFRRLPIGMRIR